MKQTFTERAFVPTQFDTAADKAKFANQFVRFVEGDFKESLFPKWFYTRLSMTFGHIAHYNQGGFYDTFFRDAASKISFLRMTLEYPAWGEPGCTYSDVEKVLKAWLIERGTLEKYVAYHAGEVEARERLLLRTLKAKYEAVP